MERLKTKFMMWCYKKRLIHFDGDAELLEDYNEFIKKMYKKNHWIGPIFIVEKDGSMRFRKPHEPLR